MRISTVKRMGEKFVVPERPYALELVDDGSKKDGTTIVIALQQPVEEQSWKFVKV